ncbi:low molecular mass lipoprotein PBMHP-6 [Plutella xylostella]|uniref:low molecular mass lipoprotein PBMHP-6 n=1 Tax=Plutella xylostella TaxID=51655 RepID=UPI002032BB5C|nr:low molecular mass lipoprotein PBMHP-6 [Plutella xylostella]
MTNHSRITWRTAKRPNYTTNIDKKYPYSEIPYMGQYQLVKIPVNDELVPLVDYWGEGRINSEFGVSGFADCYNVNHEYQLVSNGPDRDFKIPNRIPVFDYSNCDTSAYIKDNSVKVVTLMGSPLIKSCADDIARMVNVEEGKVIIYGFSENAAEVRVLETALNKKGLVFCHEYRLPELYKTLTLFDRYRAYLNVKEISEELYDSVSNAEYDKAVNISKALDTGDGSVIADTVQKLLKNSVRNTVGYAHRLWNNDAVAIVENYFPVSFKLILNGSFVKIINKKELKTLKLDGDEQWQMTAILEDGKVKFRIMNVKFKMYLGLDEKEGSEDRNAYGFPANDTTNNLKWSLLPVHEDDQVYYVFSNEKYGQVLKYHETAESEEVLLGHSHDEDKDNVDRIGWFIAPWEQ